MVDGVFYDLIETILGLISHMKCRNKLKQQRVLNDFHVLYKIVKYYSDVFIKNRFRLDEKMKRCLVLLFIALLVCRLII